MLPDDPWPSWIAFAAAIIQTIATVLQVAQGGGQRHGPRTGRRVSAGVRFGLAAFVVLFCGWPVMRNVENGAPVVRLAVFTPSVVLGAVAFLACVGGLVKSSDEPTAPRRSNPPIRKEYLPAWREDARHREAQYERDLQESRISPVSALSLALGAVAGFGIAYAELVFAGILH